MSEYQYYEFRAIDRPLTEGEMEKLRALSTRAEITPTSFTNEYHYGNFRGDPRALVKRYFDAFVFVANWGTRQLMFRIPERLIDVETAEEYCDEEFLTLEPDGERVVLEFGDFPEDPVDSWEVGKAWMDSLIGIRTELMRGDQRALYLGWLAGLPARGLVAADDDDDDDDEAFEELEPPVPAGLAKLSAPLRALVDFLRIDPTLVEAAAAGSAGEPPAEPSPVELAGWIQKLKAAEKDAYLLRFLTEEGDVALRAELRRRFREETAPRDQPGKAVLAEGRRTVGQLLAAYRELADEKARRLLAAYRELADEKARRLAEEKAKEQAKLERERAEARKTRLDALAEREEAAWREVEQLIATKLPKNYDEAVTLLADLRAVAERAGRVERADARIGELRRAHARKPSLMERLDKQGLGR